MLVKKTLHQIYEELTELRRVRDINATVVTQALAGKRGIEWIKTPLDDYRHFDEVIKYLSQIEVEYEDKYSTEEKDD